MSAAVRAACKDNDKVHVNGVRALGYLLAIQIQQGETGGPGCVSNGSKAAGAGVETDAAHWWGQDWLAQGSQCLQNSLASRNEKVTLHCMLLIASSDWLRHCAFAVMVQCMHAIKSHEEEEPGRLDRNVLAVKAFTRQSI